MSKLLDILPYMSLYLIGREHTGWKELQQQIKKSFLDIQSSWICFVICYLKKMLMNNFKCLTLFFFRKTQPSISAVTKDEPWPQCFCNNCCYWSGTAGSWPLQCFCYNAWVCIVHWYNQSQTSRLSFFSIEPSLLGYWRHRQGYYLYGWRS